MKNLYFKRSTGGYLLIKENVADVPEALKEIDAFLARHNYKSYYTRYWGDEDNGYTFDVGSWSEFFELTDKRPPIDGTEENFIDKKVCADEDM